MKSMKKIIAFNHGNGVGLVRDSRGRLVLLFNKNSGPKLYKGKSVFTIPSINRDVLR